MAISKIIIVGAGPSGLLLGILLTKAGIPVTLLDQSDHLDTNPRAAHYAPNSVVELRRAGVLSTVEERGYHPNGVCWRLLDGTILAGIRGDENDEIDPDAMIYYPFEKFDYWDSQFIVHPTNWYMAAKITPDGMWRVTYGDIWGLTTEEYLKRQPMRFEEILPGHPKPGEYDLKMASPYKLQQSGGMGLTGGIADISSLTDCLLAMHNNLTDDSILDKYSEIRIKKWKEIIDPTSRANFGRLWDEKCCGGD
ncbi:hypothetical protein G7Y89_g13328 [Cudoniella acicularis]|uniref:FAD-binding domain-containing protein n=1 Tax=Cudoniella acicularis TaxID=354080 RepID=A0A8H4R8S2_9HELO|nr:hypothetical protein G7Y89_g13328 [Cudoniella acicularis]